MYQSAQWVQNLPVREIKPLPERVLPCAKHDKTLEWTEFRDFPYRVEPGWFPTGSSRAGFPTWEEVRAWLFKNGCAAKPSYSHKAELRKLRADAGVDIETVTSMTWRCV